ncbi:MAG: hypothetical protein EBQ92_00570 [Proteobacteria bacterium]|nr:hypothetical protein [Pseudomonadota bacterium]
MDALNAFSKLIKTNFNGDLVFQCGKKYSNQVIKPIGIPPNFKKEISLYDGKTGWDIVQKIQGVHTKYPYATLSLVASHNNETFTTFRPDGLIYFRVYCVEENYIFNTICEFSYEEKNYLFFTYLKSCSATEQISGWAVEKGAHVTVNVQILSSIDDGNGRSFDRALNAQLKEKNATVVD